MIENLQNKAKHAWREASRPFRRQATFVVYALKHDYCAFAVPAGTRNAVIENTIARREETVPGRDYGGRLQPGSFNWRRVVAALDAEDAVAQARCQGLSYEPIKTILARKSQSIRPELTPQEEADINKLIELCNAFGQEKPAGRAPA